MPPLIVVLLAVAMIRTGWGRRRRVAVVGWALLVVAFSMLIAQTGAWGLAVGTSMAMVAALAALGHAASTTPAGRRPIPRDPPTVLLGRPDPRDIGRRLLVFVAVVPAGFVASAFLAWTVQRLAFASGWDPANSTVLALVLQPIAWCVVATCQVTSAARSGMIVPLAVCAGTGTFLWILA